MEGTVAWKGVPSPLCALSVTIIPITLYVSTLHCHSYIHSISLSRLDPSVALLPFHCHPSLHPSHYYSSIVNPSLPLLYPPLLILSFLPSHTHRLSHVQCHHLPRPIFIRLHILASPLSPLRQSSHSHLFTVTTSPTLLPSLPYTANTIQPNTFISSSFFHLPLAH